jgi:hypothetical protein
LSISEKTRIRIPFSLREYRIGVIQLLEELSTQPEGRTINIRILTPINNTIEKILEEMKTKTNLSEEPDDYYVSNLKLRHLGNVSLARP